jgi:hypothetical protein
MRYRMPMLLVVVVAALAAAGCHYAATTPPPAPPPPPAPDVTAQCDFSATITYVENGTPELVVDLKPFPAQYPHQNPNQSAVCWFLHYSTDDYPFSVMKLEGVDSVHGQHGGPILKGDLNFRGGDRVKMIFNDEPNWPTTGPQEVTIPYTVVGRLKGATQDLSADPDLIIKR